LPVYDHILFTANASVAVYGLWLSSSTRLRQLCLGRSAQVNGPWCNLGGQRPTGQMCSS